MLKDDINLCRSSIFFVCPKGSSGTPPSLHPPTLKTAALEAAPRAQGWPGLSFLLLWPCCSLAAPPPFTPLPILFSGFAVPAMKGLSWSPWVPSFYFSVMLSFKETHSQFLVI